MVLWLNLIILVLIVFPTTGPELKYLTSNRKECFIESLISSINSIFKMNVHTFFLFLESKFQ